MISPGRDVQSCKPLHAAAFMAADITMATTTIRDVARAAGVSVATVSRAMNGADNVLPDTKARILEAAAVLRFMPSGAARSLITRRTDTVGALHPVETIEFLITVRRIGWTKPLLLDQFPFREDPVTAALQSIETLDAMLRLVDRLDLDALAAAQSRHDAMAGQRLVLDEMLGLGKR